MTAQADVKTETTVERVARAIYGDDKNWAVFGPSEKEEWLKMSRRALVVLDRQLPSSKRINRETTIRFLENAFRHIDLPPLSVSDAADIQESLDYFLRDHADKPMFEMLDELCIHIEVEDMPYLKHLAEEKVRPLLRKAAW